MAFRPATRDELHGRICIIAPSGAGKSISALRFAMELCGVDGRIAAIDTEHGSLSKYQGDIYDGREINFDVADQMQDYSPLNYIKQIQEAASEGYSGLIIDSLTHAWAGAGGALELVDKVNSKNSYTAWNKVTPLHRRLIEAILSYPGHIISTIRAKTKYELEMDRATGKTIPRKLGAGPVQRDDVDYEFDLVLNMDQDHLCTISKTRCDPMNGRSEVRPGAEFIKPFKLWLTKGRPMENQPIEAGQRDEIVALAQTLGMPPQALQAAIYRRTRPDGQHCMKLAELSKLQANEIITGLRSKLSSVETPF